MSVYRCAVGALIIASGWLIAATIASATTVLPEKMKCAIGGKTFTYMAMASNSSWGARPDGRPYSPSPVFPMPECPDNHLIMYRDFTKAELPQLKVLIASPEYTAMTERETQRYRIAWLEKALQPKSSNIPWMLLQASWEAMDGSEQKARYQGEFIESAAVIPSEADKNEWRFLQVRVANAHRELGAFELAMSTLEPLPLKTMSEGLPTDEAAIANLSDEKQEAWYFLEFVRKLKTAIERKDRASEPLDLIPERMAAERCYFDDKTLSPFETTYCQKAEIQAEIAEAKKYWASEKTEHDKEKATN